MARIPRIISESKAGAVQNGCPRRAVRCAFRLHFPILIRVIRAIRGSRPSDRILTTDGTDSTDHFRVESWRGAEWVSSACCAVCFPPSFPHSYPCHPCNPWFQAKRPNFNHGWHGFHGSFPSRKLARCRMGVLGVLCGVLSAFISPFLSVSSV